MSSAVRQIQVVQSEIAANRLLAEGWVYLQSVAMPGGLAHVLGHDTAATTDDRKMRILREAVPVTRAMAIPGTTMPPIPPRAP